MAAPTSQIRAMTADQRRATLTLLRSLTPAKWQQPSACEGWTIQELVAHLTLPFGRQSRVLRETVRARGDFDLAADRMARQDAASRSPEDLVTQLADHVDHPWRPPGGGPAGALSHDVIHSYDLTLALGLDPVVTPERAGVVLSAFRPAHLRGFGVDLRRTRFEATDADLAIGAERERAERVVAAPVLDLIPLATGRPVAPSPG